MMKKGYRNLACIAGWAILLIAFLVIRPSLRSPLAWGLLVPALVLGGAYMILTRLDAGKERSEWEEWKTRLTGLIDKPDVENDGHLFEQFDSAEWDLIFAELQRQPSDTRSLRKAIEVVDPEFGR